MEKKYIQELKLLKYLQLPIGRKIYILGTPLHNNIGDNAIVLAEIAFLKYLGYSKRCIKELTVDEINTYKSKILKCIKSNKNSLVCWHGGGNLGNQWINEENFRRQIMSELSEMKMIIFPQTIYYTETEEGKEEEKRSISYYNKKCGLTLIAREEKSYEIMSSLYPDTSILLAPDIVLFTTMEDYEVKKSKRDEVLVCLRHDPEKALKENDEKKIMDIVESMGHSYRKTDMDTDKVITKENRKEHVGKKMQEFASARLVITDRLHGMVFAALTGTPCIVFSNYNHKVRGTYKWINYLPYVLLMENIQELQKNMIKLLDMPEQNYDNQLLCYHFEKIAEEIKKNMN